jgi:hydrogenase maturation protease
MNACIASAADLRNPPKILLIGYGNPGRQDDGLGPAVATEMAKLGLANLTVHDCYQLNIEDSIDVAEHDAVWFVDASKVAASPYILTDLSPAFVLDFTSHFVRPEVVLALAQHYYGRSPRAYLLGIRGYEFEFIEKLTVGAAENMRLAVSMLTQRLQASLAREAA